MKTGAVKIVKISLAVFAAVILLAVAASYIYYRDIKKTFIQQVSDRLSSFAGHQVAIGDISLSLSGSINIDNIRMKNPEGFPEGDLLSVQRVFLHMKYRELLQGRFHFDEVAVHSPRLSLARNSQGKINISDRLLRLFSGKPGTDYQFNEVRIIKGRIDLNNNGMFRQENISAVLQNLSSNPGTKTIIQIKTEFSGGNPVTINGWAYLKNKPRRFNIAASAEDFQLSSFRHIAEKYRIDTEKADMDIELQAEGDDAAGARVSGQISLKEAGIDFFRKERHRISVHLDSFFDLQKFSVTVHDISVQAQDIADMRLKGTVTDIIRDPAFSAALKVSRLDLSRLHFIKGVTMSGMASTGDIHVKGKFVKQMPDITGSARLVDAAIRSQDLDMQKINAEIHFSSGKKFSARAKTVAELLRAGQFSQQKPVQIALSADAQGTAENIFLSSHIEVSPVSVKLKEGSIASSAGFRAEIIGTLREKTFDGKFKLHSDEMRYSDYLVKRISAGSVVTADAGSVVLKSLNLEAEKVKTTAGLLDIKLPDQKRGYAIKIRNLHAEYPEEKAGIKDLNLDLAFRTDNRTITGSGTFSAAGILFRGIASGMISGSAKTDKDSFRVLIPRADVFGGSMNLSAEGRDIRSPYPLKILLKTGNIDLKSVSSAVSGFTKIPYAVTDGIGNVSFNGTMNASDVLHGSASVDAKGLSVTDPGTKRGIIKKSSLKAKMVFKGSDAEFTADAAAGIIQPTASGTAKDFLKKNRRLLAEITVPEVKVTDIRDYFWDIFPDKLLYAGLEGRISSKITLVYGADEIHVTGAMHLKDLMLEGENGEFSAGPVNGVIPLTYGKRDAQSKKSRMLSFEKEDFERVKQHYLKQDSYEGYNRITIGSFEYGFRLFEDVNFWIKQEGSILNIGRFSANIFGGELNGSAVVDMSEGLNYTAGVILDGVSLIKLCDNIEPIRGYISGRIDGIATLKGSGAALPGLIGKADFWTYSDREEKTKISREFLQKIGGPSVRAYLGDKRFDKGIMSLYIQKGFLIFRELEISNRNFFGIQDLSVKVAPFNNRISIDHLMWTILQAAERAKKE